MKKITKSLSAILLAFILMIASSAIYVSAAEGELEVDGKLAYKVGDKITYDMHLQSPETVIGIQMVLKYDKEYLKVDPESVKTPKFPAAVKNAYLEDRVILVWTNATEGAIFTTEDTLIKVDFEVLKEGKTDITYVIQEMYSNDLTYLKEYAITVDYSENGTVIKEGDVPIVEKDPDFLDENQGDFPNYEDGKGQNNSDVEDDRTVVTSPNKVNEPAADNNGGSNSGNGNNSGVSSAGNLTDANGNIVATNVQGEALPTDANGNYLDENGNALKTDENGNYVDKDGNVYQENNTTVTEPENPVDIVPIIIIAVIILAAVAIVIVVVLKTKNGKDEPEAEKDDSSEDIGE